ncbi:tyrosine-type recombinase/integrase [Streptomyces fagopyri]|uniref:Tyrosine-type recombinase/integrase n=1 Tax=Streptomyces fagopyri TaxID=2662397 RepID=A0A5Q0LAE3_9ACTN|nr:site-specific integrase [Streptomyces fagopyri]QFZ74000.1 tyrosine-type recombinase/integrase [Streptomyces fagopyri]
MSQSSEIAVRRNDPAETLDNTTPPLSGAAREALAAGTADSTRRAYSSDWSEFTTWCATNGRPPLPASPETVVEYVAALTTTPRPRTGRPYSPSSIERAIAAIRTAHTAADVAPPSTKGARIILRGYRDRLARAKDPAAKTRKAQPAVPTALRAMLDTLDRDTLQGKRDAALLLLGFATAARVSELVALDLADVPETDNGIEASVYRRKVKAFSDTAVPFGSNPSTCPVRAVRALREALAEAGRTEGPLFVRIDRHGRIAPPMFRHGVPIGDPAGRLTAQAAAQVIERAAEVAGLEGQWSGHSLRRGFATAARKAGHDLVRIGRHGGWADGSKALLGYFEDSDRWEDNPVAGTGL